jgi:ribosome biogenesis protein BRX1
VKHSRLLNVCFAQIFNTPKGHPGSKPFIDHVVSFMLADGKIWFRNYQVSHVGFRFFLVQFPTSFAFA